MAHYMVEEPVFKDGSLHGGGTLRMAHYRVEEPVFKDGSLQG